MPSPRSSPASVEPPVWPSIARLIALALGVRLALFALYFLGKHGTWDQLLANSDAGSFLRMARVLVLGDSPQILSFYDLRVFPGWPLLVGGLLPVLPPTAAMILPTLAFAVALPCVFFLLTRSLAASPLMMRKRST